VLWEDVSFAGFNWSLARVEFTSGLFSTITFRYYSTSQILVEQCFNEYLDDLNHKYNLVKIEMDNYLKTHGPVDNNGNMVMLSLANWDSIWICDLSYTWGKEFSLHDEMIMNNL
jgi:hypothetical protein